MKQATIVRPLSSEVPRDRGASKEGVIPSADVRHATFLERDTAQAQDLCLCR